MTLKWATSVDDRDVESAGFTSRSLVDAKWERRTQRGLAYTINATHAGADFRPELGFMQRRDFTTANAYGNWYIFTDNSSRFRRVYPGALVFTTYRNATGVLESGTYAFWLQWDTKAGGGGWLEPKWFHEDVQQTFTIGKNITVPAGRYDFADFQVALSMAPGRKIRTGIDVRSGTYFDGKRTQAIVSPTWNLSKHLELGSDYQFTRLTFESRKQATDIHVARLRIRAAVDAQKSGNAFVQYNSTTERLELNVRLRYAFAEGTDLWLVYNEGLDTQRARDDIGILPPLSLGRSLILKYSHTFAF
jgi:hypothetical protein